MSKSAEKIRELQIAQYKVRKESNTMKTWCRQQQRNVVIKYIANHAINVISSVVLVIPTTGPAQLS